MLARNFSCMEPMREPGAPETGGQWPALPYPAWRDTRETLHLWTQIVGKTRLALTPRVNHWWNVTLYVTARGLGTSLMPCGAEMFDAEFDFVAHRLRLRTLTGREAGVDLYPRTVADFYAEYLARLRDVGIEVPIFTKPQELADPIQFDHDTVHASYDGEAAARFWRVLAIVAAVLQEFRARFIGKCSPVHFFWGGFDLAVSRFSGRPAPPRRGADRMSREAYSHETSSVGFWPGDPSSPEPAFFSYIAPAPPGLERAAVQPKTAAYAPDFGGWFLKYDEVRASPSPRLTLLDFCQTAYEAGADLAHWPRAQLERG
ncbi:MAG TPA: DUF5996 family protein [bacterium]|nr:DUF5996 family protein [bacterium]